MNLIQQLTHARWHPVPPPLRGDTDRRAFHVSMLIPGLSGRFHQAALGRGYTSVLKYRTDARAAAEEDPQLQAEAMAAAAAFTPADGLAMARLRGSCQLPFWSRLAIVEYRKQGYTMEEIAEAFRCAPRTVGNAASRTLFLSPDRVLTRYQLHPPAKKSPKS